MTRASLKIVSAVVLGVTLAWKSKSCENEFTVRGKGSQISGGTIKRPAFVWNFYLGEKRST